MRNTTSYFCDSNSMEPTQDFGGGSQDQSFRATCAADSKSRLPFKYLLCEPTCRALQLGSQHRCLMICHKCGQRSEASTQTCERQLSTTTQSSTTSQTGSRTTPSSLLSTHSTLSSFNWMWSCLHSTSLQSEAQLLQRGGSELSIGASPFRVD